MLSERSNSRGDTIIEVMLAFAVFALLAVGAMAIMNKGVATAQRSLEITLVRAQIDAQADALRYIHDTAHKEGATASEKTAWTTIASNSTFTVVKAAKFGVDATGACRPIPAKAFVVNARTGVRHTGTIQSADTAPFSEVTYDLASPNTITSVAGIWIQSVRETGTAQKFVDFHIRACWYAADGKPVTLGTIVRMYDAVS